MKTSDLRKKLVWFRQYMEISGEIFTGRISHFFLPDISRDTKIAALNAKEANDRLQICTAIFKS